MKKGPAVNKLATETLDRYFAAGVHGTHEYNMRRLVHELHEAGLVIVPAQATDNMAGYAKHRNPGVERELAKGVWHSMVDEAINGR